MIIYIKFSRYILEKKNNGMLLFMENFIRLFFLQNL